MSDILIEGKTKIVRPVPGSPELVDIHNKDSITAGDGARAAAFQRKGEYATQVNHYVMQHLSRKKIPTAYHGRKSANVFQAFNCAMLPFEVVAVRQVANKSSLSKRELKYTAGYRFAEPEVFFFLKTTGKKFGSFTFEKDDPYISEYTDQGLVVRRPDVPLTAQAQTQLIPFSALNLGREPQKVLDEMALIARTSFLHLEEAWKMLGCQLLDFKEEFGISLAHHRLLLADIMSPDEWRLLSQYGVHLDKQPFRNDEVTLGVIAERYREVAERVVAFDAM